MKIDKRYRAAMRKLIDMADFDCIVDREITDAYVAITVQTGDFEETFTFLDSGSIIINRQKRGKRK